MTNYSRTTLRELKKRYLNILKKCLLANLGIILLSTPSMAEPTTYTAEEIYEKLTNGETVGISGQIISEPIQAGVFTGWLTVTNGSNITFEDGSVFKDKGISLGYGQTNDEVSMITFGKTEVIGTRISSLSGKGKIFFEDSLLVQGGGVEIAGQSITFKKVEFYNGTYLHMGGRRGALMLEATGQSLIDGEAIFGKYILDENGNILTDGAETPTPLYTADQIYIYETYTYKETVDVHTPVTTTNQLDMYLPFSSNTVVSLYVVSPSTVSAI